jgi:hypothetical protein
LHDAVKWGDIADITAGTYEGAPLGQGDRIVVAASRGAR